MYITICKIDDQCKIDAWSRALRLVLWDNPEGWGGEVGGKGIQDGGHMYAHGWFMSVQFSSVQSLSHVWLFATPWIAARQASLSIINSQSLPKPMSIESVMPFNHLILCRLLLLLLPILPSIRVLSNESILHVRWPKYWSFSFNISPSNEHPGLSSFRMDWLDLLAVMYGKNHYNIVK